MSKRMVVDLDVDKTAIDTNLDKRYHLGSVHSDARAQMPEKQLFSFAEYKAQDAERIGYSNYSYWKSVWQNFLKKKSAVFVAIVFVLLFIFTFVAVKISRFDANNLRIDTKLMFTSPNKE